MFWEELLEAYPEAKVVLVERDVDAWWKSFSEGILPGLYSKKVDFIINYVEPAVGPRTAHACRKMYGGYLGSGWGPEQLEVIKANAKDRYREHFRRIREAVPKDRLLNYELGSGWVSWICRWQSMATSLTCPFAGTTLRVLGQTCTRCAFSEGQ